MSLSRATHPENCSAGFVFHDDWILKKLFNKFINFFKQGKIKILLMPKVPNIKYWIEVEGEIPVDGDYYRELGKSKDIIKVLTKLGFLTPDDYNNSAKMSDMISDFCSDFMSGRTANDQLILSVPNRIHHEECLWVQTNLVTSVYFIMWSAFSMWGSGQMLEESDVMALTDIFTGRFVCLYAKELMIYEHYYSLVTAFQEYGSCDDYVLIQTLIDNL